MPRPVVVATAAPATPRRGNGPRPKIRQGSRQMLIALAIHKTRIAIAASPAPRNTALIRNNIMMTPLKPNRMAVKDECARTSGVAPINPSNGRANAKPARPAGTATSRPSAIACTAAIAAPSGSFSPMRRATVAVAPIPSPIATE